MTRPNPSTDGMAAELDELSQRIDVLPTLDTRSVDEILATTMRRRAKVRNACSSLFRCLSVGNPIQH